VDVGRREARRNVLSRRRPGQFDNQIEQRQPAGAAGKGIGSGHLSVRGLVALVPLPDVIIGHFQERVLPGSEGKAWCAQQAKANPLRIGSEILDLDDFGAIGESIGPELQAQTEPQRQEAAGTSTHQIHHLLRSVCLPPQDGKIILGPEAEDLLRLVIDELPVRHVGEDEKNLAP